MISQPLLFSIPALIYWFWQRRRGTPVDEIYRYLGWQAGKWIDYLFALGIAAVTLLVAVLVRQVVPAEVFTDPRISLSGYTGLEWGLGTFLRVLVIEAFSRALGEELLFRGFLGCLLVRKLGFRKGNLIQAAVFLLPQLVLFSVSLKLWPLLVFQFVMGWLLGWLCERSESILPGWLAHSLANALAALLILH